MLNINYELIDNGTWHDEDVFFELVKIHINDVIKLDETRIKKRRLLVGFLMSWEGLTLGEASRYIKEKQIYENYL